jgi:hypothetical protein
VDVDDAKAFLLSSRNRLNKSPTLDAPSVVKATDRLNARRGMFFAGSARGRTASRGRALSVEVGASMSSLRVVREGGYLFSRATRRLKYKFTNLNKVLVHRYVW